MGCRRSRCSLTRLLQSRSANLPRNPESTGGFPRPAVVLCSLPRAESRLGPDWRTGDCCATDTQWAQTRDLRVRTVPPVRWRRRACLPFRSLVLTGLFAPDASLPDPNDAGIALPFEADAGEADAGEVDGGEVDAGSMAEVDAGLPVASADAGAPVAADAGLPDTRSLGKNQRLPKGFSGVVGRVTDSRTGEGLIEATIKVVAGGKKTALTDVDGYYRLKLVLPAPTTCACSKI